MSDRGAYQLADGTFRRTQVEAQKTGQSWEKVAIPVDSHGLIDYLNGIIERERATPGVEPAAVDQDQSDDAPAEEIPLAAPVSAPASDEAEMRRKLALQLRGLEADAIEEKIAESKGPVFARFLLAGIERLGVLGPQGWEQMQAFLDRDYQRPGCVDRGLRYLSLAQIASLNGDAKP